MAPTFNRNNLKPQGNLGQGRITSSGAVTPCRLVKVADVSKDTTKQSKNTTFTDVSRNSKVYMFRVKQSKKKKESKKTTVLINVSMCRRACYLQGEPITGKRYCALVGQRDCDQYTRQDESSAKSL